MTDRHRRVVPGFTLTPTHHQAGGIIGVSVFALHRSFDQDVQHNRNRPVGKCIDQFTVRKRSPQTIAAEQQYIAGLQPEGIAVFHVEHVLDPAEAVGDVVALRMDACLLGCNLPGLDPMLHDRVIGGPGRHLAVAQQVKARVPGMPPVHLAILYQCRDTGCPGKPAHIIVVRKTHDAVVCLLHGIEDEFVGIGNTRLVDPAKCFDKCIDGHAGRQLPVQMPAHPVRQHQQQNFVTEDVRDAILVESAIADMAGLVYREVHGQGEDFTGRNRNIMSRFSPAFYSKVFTMILSMTGYATAGAELDSGSLTLELRAVNHRYLDIQLRMPDELRGFEGELRVAINAQLQRGKVECRVNYAARSAQCGAELNSAMLRQLAAWNDEVRSRIPDARGLSVAEVLRWNGLLETPAASAEELRAALLDLMQTVLQEFSASRAREGEKLKDFLLQRLEKIEVLRNGVMPHVPAAIAAYEQKLITRLQDAMQNAQADIWDERVRQEITLFASKIDVDEELSRLASHLAEMRRILGHGGAVGKRLDFLMQELNREANTLGSKSVDADVSRCAMEMKILIEQMREQIQNLE